MKIRLEEISRYNGIYDSEDTHVEISEFSGTKKELLKILEEYDDDFIVKISPIIQEKVKEAPPLYTYPSTGTPCEPPFTKNCNIRHGNGYAWSGRDNIK